MSGIAPGPTEIWVPAILILVGVAGIVVPVLPGLVLVLLGVLLWAFAVGTTTAWAVLGVAVALFAVGTALSYLVPGRRLKQQGVGNRTLLLAAGLGVVGFFVVPVLGAPLGFVLGIYLVEQGRSRDRAAAWLRTKHALAAVATSIGIDLVTALLIAVTWVGGVLLSR